MCCRVSPNLREWTYCNGLMEANASTWNKLLGIYVNKSNKEALKYLACSENPDILINFINISTSNNSIIQDEDHNIIHSSIITKHADNNVIVDYVLANLEKIVSRYINNIFYIDSKHFVFFLYLLIINLLIFFTENMI